MINTLTFMSCTISVPCCHVELEISLSFVYSHCCIVAVGRTICAPADPRCDEELAALLSWMTIDDTDMLNVVAQNDPQCCKDVYNGR